MIICETEFNAPDPQDPEIAMNEVDYYAWVPQIPGVANHRLTLRKRLATGQYEVYMAITKRLVGALANVPGAIAVTHKESGDEYTIFASTDLQAAIDFADSKWHEYHDTWAKDWPGGNHQKDQVCTHKYPTRAYGCKVKYGGA